MYTNVQSNFIDVSLKLKTTQCPLTDEWLSKLWQTPTMEYCSEINKNELLKYATA